MEWKFPLYKTEGKSRGQKKGNSNLDDDPPLLSILLLMALLTPHLPLSSRNDDLDRHDLGPRIMGEATAAVIAAGAFLQ